jgi:Ca-activated chloride channel family protein
VAVPRFLAPTALALAVFSATVAGAGAVADQQAPPSFRSSATQVAVTAAVRQPNGAPVTNLTRDDFEILDNGQLRAISTFWSEPSAASVALLVDQSGSMALGGRLDQARAIANQFLQSLYPGVDQVALLAFDRDVARVLPFTTSPARILAELARLDAYGSTALVDAMATGANEVAERGMRRAVVVLTDGLDTASRMSTMEVSRLAARIDVPVYVLMPATALERATASTERAGITELARRTGGEAFVVTTPAEGVAATRAIASDLHHQYLMAFASDGAPGWHALDVRVKKHAATLLVRARTGYDAGARNDIPHTAPHGAGAD